MHGLRDGEAICGTRLYSKRKAGWNSAKEKKCWCKLSVAYRLPPPAAEELAALAERLANLPPTTRLNWSDSWSERDLQEFTRESIRRLEDDERDPNR